MAINKEIHDLVVKYYNLFTNPRSKEWAVETSFSDKCFALGFEMDGEKVFQSVSGCPV
jgi:hypothetical protein